MGDTNNGGNRPGSVNGAERAELDAVLASSTFARAQRLVRLLEYVCARHFEGRGGEVCEYSIATEVLGRPTNFDPAEDAIARVEIHRLRKKLREYYAAEGSHQALKIIIPPGMYTPVFQHDGNLASERENGNGAPPPIDATPAEPVAEPTPAEPEAPAVPPKPRSRKRWLWLAGIPIAAAAIILAVLRTGPGRQPQTPHAVPATPVGAVPDTAVRIVAGYDRKYIDHHGHTWLPDRYFEGGGQPKAPFRQFIARTADPLLYQNGRIGVNAYNIPLKSPEPTS